MMYRLWIASAAALLAGCATVELGMPAPVEARSPVSANPATSPSPAPFEQRSVDTGVIVHEVTVANPTVRPIDPSPGTLAGNRRSIDAQDLSSGASSGGQGQQGNAGGQGGNANAASTEDGILLMPPKAVPGQPKR